MIPGTKQRVPLVEGEAKMFHESERNCNTCKHLQRVSHPKCPAGFLQGHCLHHPYGTEFVMKFHPKDPMHMRCYEPRLPKETEE